MKRALFIAATMAIAAPQVFAQANSFEGFSIGANAETAAATTTLIGTASDTNTDTGLALQAQYTFALAPQFTLGVGATLGTNTLKTGAINGVTYSTKDKASFDLVPGYAISDTTLLYGKLSALSGTVAADANGVGSSSSLSGVGYGLGVRYLINKNVFVQGDINSNRYNDVNTTGLSETTYAFGVGYKF